MNRVCCALICVFAVTVHVGCSGAVEPVKERSVMSATSDRSLEGLIGKRDVDVVQALGEPDDRGQNLLIDLPPTVDAAARRDWEESVVYTVFYYRDVQICFNLRGMVTTVMLPHRLLIEEKLLKDLMGKDEASVSRVLGLPDEVVTGDSNGGDGEVIDALKSAGRPRIVRRLRFRDLVLSFSADGKAVMVERSRHSAN